MPLIGFPLHYTHLPFVPYSSLPMVPIPSINTWILYRILSQVLMCFLYSQLDIVYFKFFSAFIGEVGTVPRMVTTFEGGWFWVYYTMHLPSQHHLVNWGIHDLKPIVVLFVHPLVACKKRCSCGLLATWWVWGLHFGR